MHGTLSDLIRIKANWTRSVNIERDAAEWTFGSAHYTLTPMARAIMEQAVSGIQQEKGTRAWTITGPYGTGKSAFSLALSQLLSPVGSSSTLYADLRNEDPELAARFEQIWASGQRFLPVLINGRREALVPALAAGLRRALRAAPFKVEGRKSLLARLKVLQPADAVGLTTLFEETARRVGGLLVIVDELGKFLEYTAQRPDQSDVFVLQLLAEAAARSQGTPLVIFGILHQAFVRFGAQLTQAQREEFGKIQGRFQDIAFNQSHDLMLRLMGNALQSSSGDWVSAEAKLREQVRALSEEAITRNLGLGGIAREEAVDLLVRCAPIHPITALILGPLFRRLAQNERSLFNFISSPEPFGLREFLQRTPADTHPVPLYTPDLLYDYVMSSLGTSLYQDVGGRRWSQIEATLDRLRDGTPLEVRIVKTIGILAAVGETGNLRAAPDVITLCFQEPAEEVQSTLRRLAEKKVLVYRSFVDAYRLWEGSDVDIEERLNAARAYVDEAKGLDELLAVSAPPRPIVARRHSFERGTLRFFEVTYTSVGKLSAKLSDFRWPQADGRLLYVLVESVAQQTELEGSLTSGEYTRDLFTVIVPLHVPAALQGAALELERLKWVKDHTPELIGDFVAQRELRSRYYETEQILRREVEFALSPDSSELLCFWNGKSQWVKGPRALNQFLSLVCDEVYHDSPVIQNELINRRQLSSAAAAARRLLMEAMLEGAEQRNLGIEGHPPQLSMYLSVLAHTGLHVQGAAGAWQFAAPDSKSPLVPVWRVWQEFLDGCRELRRSLGDLWQQLTRPPIGLRAGVIPVLILAMLQERQMEVGLYEAGTFVPDLTLPHLERFMRNPEKFEVRYCPMDGLRLEVFSELTRAVGGRAEQSLVPLVRALVRNVAKLPPYSQKTQSISEKAQAVRAALMSAKEPDVLLFTDLPHALNYPSMFGDDVPSEVVQPFVQDLVAALRELNSAHRFLLEKLFSLLVSALGLPDRPEKALSELQRRVSMLRHASVDLRVKGFLDHLVPPAVPELLDKWVESLGSFVASRPPSTWNDSDLVRFEAELAVLARRLKHLEDIAFALGQFGGSDDVEALRIGLTTKHGEELHKVVWLAPAQQQKIQRLESQFALLLRDHDISKEEEQLAVLVLMTQQLLKRESRILAKTL